MDAKEYLNGRHITVEINGSPYRISTIQYGFIQLLEEYHLAKSKEEAEERYIKAAMFIIEDDKVYVSKRERTETFNNALLIASGKEKE